MAKTCRTCEFCYPRYGCSEAKMPLECITTDYGCSEHKPRETPLLTDELTEVMEAILNAMSGQWFSYTKLPGKIKEAEKEAQKLVDRAYALLARHKEEMGNA